MNIIKRTILLISVMLTFLQYTDAQTLDTDPIKIIKKANDKLQGTSSKAELKMTIVRPSWSREMKMKAWSKGDDYSLTLITGPARDKGVAFLKREKEVWNWQPKIDREVKLPPSMMAQSLMGSDFTNNDLVDQAATIDDYTHKILGSEVIRDRDCYKVELIPNEETAVVWGKIISWIDKKDFMQLKAEFYDEEDYLVNTMIGDNVKTLGGKLIPSRLTITPADEPENKTIVEYLSLEFDKPIKDKFFSVQNMKRIR